MITMFQTWLHCHAYIITAIYLHLDVLCVLENLLQHSCFTSVMNAHQFNACFYYHISLSLWYFNVPSSWEARLVISNPICMTVLVYLKPSSVCLNGMTVGLIIWGLCFMNIYTWKAFQFFQSILLQEAAVYLKSTCMFRWQSSAMYIRI